MLEPKIILLKCLRTPASVEATGASPHLQRQQTKPSQVSLYTIILVNTPRHLFSSHRRNLAKSTLTPSLGGPLARTPCTRIRGDLVKSPIHPHQGEPYQLPYTPASGETLSKVSYIFIRGTLVHLTPAGGSLSRAPYTYISGNPTKCRIHHNRGNPIESPLHPHQGGPCQEPPTPASGGTLSRTLYTFIR